MSAEVDAIVIGAGIVGLAIARALAMSGQDVVVIEKAKTIGTATSSRSSEVIHAGIYYPSDSLKARLCVEGNGLLYDFCKNHGVSNRNPGKLIVSVDAEEETKLESIQQQAISNGVGDVKLLTRRQVFELEPELKCTAALLSPSTGIVDVQGLMLALQASAESHGTTVAFQTQFSGAEKRDGLFQISTIGAAGETNTLTCTTLINCAGHGAHAAAKAIGGFPFSQLPPRFLAKGNYCSLSGRSPFRHLIYPVPVSGALGIHATLDISNAMRFGPDIEWVDNIDYGMKEALPEKFKSAVKKYWPGVESRTLSPSYCGIRPKLHGPDTGFADFIIQFPEQHGIANLVNLFGIESPGITASLAIARYVSERCLFEQT